MTDTVKIINTCYDDAEAKPNLKPILRLPFKEIESAFVIVSFAAEKVSKAHLDFYVKYQEPFCKTEPMLSFFYAGPDQGAEWLPPHGPIMCYRKCDETWRGKTFHGTELRPKQHWYYELVQNEPLAWSQLATDREELPRKLDSGDFEGIFYSLKNWALRDD